MSVIKHTKKDHTKINCNFFGPVVRVIGVTAITQFMEVFKPAAVADRAAVEAEFTEIVNAHIDQVYNYASYMVLDKDEAFDIVQTTFLALFKNFSKLDRSKPIRPWIYKVARNNCLDYLKKKKALNFSELNNEVLEVPESDYDLEAQAGSEIFQDKVKEIFGILPTTVKEVMILKYFDDLTFEEIAEHMQIPVNTVKSHFYRGKSKVCQILKDQVYGHN